MKSRTLLSTIVLLVLSACAGTGSLLGESRAGQTQPKERQRAAACHEERCIITVSVTSTCVVTIDPYFIVMTNRNPVTMEWLITGGTFAPGAIRWKEPAAKAVFSAGKGDERKAVVVNNRSAIGLFHYGVTVKTGEKTCPELDPTGINEPP